jgi:predicted nucleic acid-binding protein
VTVLLDTDISIEILRGRNQVIGSKWLALVASGAVVACSPVIAAEIWVGALPHEHQLISIFFRPLICIPTDYEIGRLAGELLRTYAKSHGLEVPDSLIAATSILYKADLWTRNRKHYPMPQLTFYS